VARSAHDEPVDLGEGSGDGALQREHGTAPITMPSVYEWGIGCARCGKVEACISRPSSRSTTISSPHSPD